MHNARCRERMTVGYEYNASGAKARANFPTIGLERHYLGGVFERDERSWGDPDDPWGGPCGSETVQRLFLGGSAYNAPMVLAKVNDETFHRAQNMAFSSTGRPICHFPCSKYGVFRHGTILP